MTNILYAAAMSDAPEVSASSSGCASDVGAVADKMRSNYSVAISGSVFSTAPTSQARRSRAAS